MDRTIRARYSKGMIEPLEKLDIEEGKELSITVAEVPGEPTGEDALDSTFGGWVGLIDGEELKRNVYADRLIKTRSKVRL